MTRAEFTKREFEVWVMVRGAPWSVSRVVPFVSVEV